MHTEIVRGLRIRHASLFDQPHSLKLELACKLSPLHDPPPVPSKHLTRCLRNRVQPTSIERVDLELDVNRHLENIHSIRNLEPVSPMKVQSYRESSPTEKRIGEPIAFQGPK